MLSLHGEVGAEVKHAHKPYVRPTHEQRAVAAARFAEIEAAQAVLAPQVACLQIVCVDRALLLKARKDGDGEIDNSRLRYALTREQAPRMWRLLDWLCAEQAKLARERTKLTSVAWNFEKSAKLED